MLYVIEKIEEEKGSIHREFTWHIGAPFNECNSNLVEMVQADGDELTWIASHFRHLPTYTGSVVRWYGDQAKAIAWAIHCEGMRFKR